MSGVLSEKTDKSCRIYLTGGPASGEERYFGDEWPFVRVAAVSKPMIRPSSDGFTSPRVVWIARYNRTERFSIAGARIYIFDRYEEDQ